MKTVALQTGTEAETEAVGARLSSAVGRLKLVYLHGPLGAGKTTLVRGLLRALGHAGAVKSPTFTLVRPYRLNGHVVYHFDLYRLQDPEELEFIGLRDYLEGRGLCVVEWAERGGRLLPAPDVDVMISPVNNGRSVRLTAYSDQGEAWLGLL